MVPKRGAPRNRASPVQLFKKIFVESLFQVVEERNSPDVCAESLDRDGTVVVRNELYCVVVARSQYGCRYRLHRWWRKTVSAGGPDGHGKMVFQ